MTIKNYSIGFVLSLGLVAAAYVPVELHVSSHHTWPPHSFIIPAVIIFALVQCAVQLVFFLHLGAGRASRDKLIVFGFAVGVVLILTSGSLWIMNTLSGRMTHTPEQMTEYMNNQQGI